MMAAAVHATDQEELTRLVVSVAGRSAPDEVAELLGGDIERWLGEGVPLADTPPGMRRYLTDLRLRVGDHPSLTTFRKAAFVDIGPVLPINDGIQLEIGWRAATLAPLFPVFAGELVVRSGELRISGYYAPPGGGLGRLADRVLLNIAARGTASWLLGRIDEAARRPR